MGALVFLAIGPLSSQKTTPAAGAREVPPKSAAEPASREVPAASAEIRRPLKIAGKKFLPLRVLARPFSHIYKQRDPGKGTVMENVPTFQPFYVYGRFTGPEGGPGASWYEVGSDTKGAVLGWMRAEDVFEWKQAMCLAFTSPVGRKPVLMFGQRAKIEDIINSDQAKRKQTVKGLYQQIDSKTIPKDFPVRSVEPKQAVDLATQFYFLPILEFNKLELAGREGRLVKLAAATATTPEARQKTDLGSNPEYLAQATRKSTEASKAVMGKLKVDVVFVMDTTMSMRPYIQTTLEALRNVAQGITDDPQLSSGIRFGVWGYRDPSEQIRGIGYTTHNYTPVLQPVEAFLRTLAGVEVTSIDSVDIAEDVFSGIDDAIAKTAWRPGAIRILILVGDAPGHELGHKYNASGKGPDSLRVLANDSKVYIFALAVKDPRFKRHHDKIEAQFRGLSRNKGMGDEPAYYPVSSTDIPGFAQATVDLNLALQGMIATAQKSEPAPAKAAAHAKPAPGVAKGAEAKAEAETAKPGAPGKLARKMFKAALVEWIGQQNQAKAPRDIVAWAVDKDLLDPAIPSMEVKLLVTKRQLNSLCLMLKEVMAAGRRGQIAGEDFFKALQATAATAARDPNLIKHAKILSETGLVPEFLLGLPYKSRLMSLSNDLWQRWSVDEQDEFLASLGAKVKAYKSIHDQPDGWIAMNKGDEPGDYVYPVSLDLLP